MQGIGTIRLRPKALSLASACVWLAASVPAEGIEAPLTDLAGDAVAGRAIVIDQQKGLCVLCHSGPFPEHQFMGTLGPDLSGVGNRLSVPELRQRMVDSRIVNADTIMPPYFSTKGLSRVGEAWQGATILTAQDVEDVVAYLATMRGTTE